MSELFKCSKCRSRKLAEFYTIKATTGVRYKCCNDCRVKVRCVQCDKEFVAPCALKTHIKTVHDASIHISLYVMSVYMYVHTYHTYIFSIHTHIVFRPCLASMCKGLEPIHISRVDFNVQLMLTHGTHVPRTRSTYMFHVHVPYTCTLHVYLFLYMLLYFTVTRRMHPYVLHMFYALYSSDLINMCFEHNANTIFVSSFLCQCGCTNRQRVVGGGCVRLEVAGDLHPDIIYTTRVTRVDFKYG